jgi:hypothetical protein
MPLKKDYLHFKGFNIPKTTKGPAVERCIARNYAGCRTNLSADTPANKRICAAVAHKRCG